MKGFSLLVSLAHSEIGNWDNNLNIRKGTLTYERKTSSRKA